MDHTRRTSDWQDLAFGLFIHFGLYSLLGGVHDGQIIRRGYSEQILSHGHLPQADYEALTSEFTLPAFDAQHIARTAREAGMRYVVITTKHHDGFCLFDTETTDYKSTNSACKKDIVQELAEACTREGLTLGLYYSWIDWHFPQALPISSHNSDAIPPAHQVLNIAQLTELLSNYGPISELWMDMGAPTPEQSREVKSLVRTLQPRCMVNGRIWNDEQDFLTMGDNQLPTVALNCPWQTPASIYKETWGYRSWQERGDKEEKIRELSETARTVVSQGGNYLLNIGLMGDGAIQPFEEQVLIGIGEALKEQPLKRSATIEVQPVTFLESELLLSTPQILHRYTGGEYYSYRPIATTLVWTISVEEQIDVSIAWQREEALESQQKICFEIDGDSYHASLQKGRSSDPLISGYTLTEGVHTITIHTVGAPLMRAELTCVDLCLLLKKESTDEDRDLP
ncbi:MAG: alpha-L-fucosidase [Sphaerochaeta sp.]|jgi:alpha-L-fucosidase|nr:alpha-L-fucosidase [Sphaerochaeta sp.]